MTTHGLTTSESKIIESEDEERTFLFSVGAHSTTLVVYLRIGDVGAADYVFAYRGTAKERLVIPRGRPVYAWTNTGTATMCTMRV